MRRAAPFAAAYGHGALSWVQALTLLPVIARATARDWVARADAVTVRRLTDEVNWVLTMRDVYGNGYAAHPASARCHSHVTGPSPGAAQGRARRRAVPKGVTQRRTVNRCGLDGGIEPDERWARNRG
jgi:hypothetical protein